mgnify:CR=1 FL=1
MQDKSRGAPTKAPTAKDPDSTKDLPIISTAQNINQPIRPRRHAAGSPGSRGGDRVTGDTKTPDREPMTYYKGEMVPRREVERIQAAEATPATTPPPQEPAPMPATVDPTDPRTTRRDEVGAGPVETMRVKHDPAPEPAPVTPVTPPRIRSSVPPTPIGIEGIALDIASDRGIWYVGIYRDGEKIADDANRSNPLYTKGTPTRIADRIKQAAPHFDRAAVRKATEQFFKAVTDADEPLTSDAVYRVISATERVEREMSDPPAYAVYLDNGDCLEFSNRDLAAAQPIALNERWQAIRFEPLRATQRDFGEIIDHWFSMAVPVDPPGAKSPWERIAEKLETRIAPLSRETDRSALKKHGIWQDPKPGGLLWVRSDLIQEVITEAGENPNDGRFARYLERSKILIERSKLIRVPGAGVPVRAWGLAPEFKIDLDDGLGGSLAEDPVGD